MFLLFVCVQCDWELVSVCLDLLVILARLFRGNKKVTGEDGGGREGESDRTERLF